LFAAGKEQAGMMLIALGLAWKELFDEWNQE